MFSIERKEEQVLVEAGREFQIEVAVYESEKEKPSRGSGERNEEFQWMIMMAGSKWWERLNGLCQERDTCVRRSF